jgi:hypothetical protein
MVNVEIRLKGSEREEGAYIYVIRFSPSLSGSPRQRCGPRSPLAVEAPGACSIQSVYGYDMHIDIFLSLDYSCPAWTYYLRVTPSLPTRIVTDKLTTHRCYHDILA